MSYSCKILLDSISETGKRLTTFEITFPRIVLAEFNTHRMFSRNSASSRAIPLNKQLDKLIKDPFVPERFPLNSSGMQPQVYIEKNDPLYREKAIAWLNARHAAMNHARYLGNALRVHKQICNRLLEPFMWHTVIVTATEWDNFFKLRTHPDAQYEIKRVADLMYEAYHAFDDDSNYKELIVSSVDVFGNSSSTIKSGEWQAIRPQKLKVGEWHCPLVYEEDIEPIMQFIQQNFKQIKRELGLGILEDVDKVTVAHTPNAIAYIKKKISVARCARVSYLTHDEKRDIERDLELFERLRTSGHYSPFEHVCTPSFTNGEGIRDSVLLHKVLDNNGNIRNANLWGWKQMRQDLPNENCTYFRKEQ